MRNYTWQMVERLTSYDALLGQILDFGLSPSILNILLVRKMMLQIIMSILFSCKTVWRTRALYNHVFRYQECWCHLLTCDNCHFLRYAT